jgi:thymidylate synthase
MLEFKWAVKADKVLLVNPMGTVAICSLWTPVSHLEKIWRAKAPELLAKESPLSLVGGLYGGGLKIMLRNLHHNPQIDTVVLLGKDFSGAVEHLVNFFKGQVIRTGRKQLYVFDDGRKEELEKLEIQGSETSHALDELIRPELFDAPPRIVDWTPDPNNAAPEKLSQFLAAYAPKAPAPNNRPQAIPLPKPLTETFPSELASHVIVAETILEGWDELLYRLSRFGRLIRLRNGKERNELLNVKVVIKNPGRYFPDDLTRRNLSESKIKAYQADLLKSELTEGGSSYTYGHRLGQYFKVNLLETVARDLAINLDSRHGYATLWDNVKDPFGSDSPCLVSLFFRKIKNLTHLTATFRSHNGARAWPANCFGLLGLLSFVCETANADPNRTEEFDLEPGRLIVISHSISLDPSELTEVAGRIESFRNRPYKIEKDPNGYFKVAIDPEKKEIVAYHYDHDDELIDEYRGRTAQEISHKLWARLAVSDLGHALYLGGQLERAWRCLELGLEYVQDKKRPV